MKVVSKIKPVNNASFKIADAEDIEIDGTDLKNKINGLSSQLSDTANNLPTLSVKLFGAIGDGITDDTNAIKECIKRARDKYKVYFPAGTYIISEPLEIFLANNDEKVHNFIVGEGRGISIIKKINNSTINNGINENIDCVICLKNTHMMNNENIDYIYDNRTMCHNFYIDNIELKGNTTTKYGIYTTGLFFGKFFNVEFSELQEGIFTKIWNCYNTYERLEFTKTLGACNFLTDIGGNSTMLFKDCHTNGVDGFGYKVKGKTTFINCSSDGGLLIPYDFRGAEATLIACHFESPVAQGLVWANNSNVNIIDCNCESTMKNGSVNFKSNNKSTLIINNCNVFRAQRGDLFPLVSPSKLQEVDEDSIIRYYNKNISLDFEEYIPIAVDPNEETIVLNRNYFNRKKRKFISYVSAITDSSKYIKISESIVDNKLNLSARGGGNAVVLIEEGFKLDNFSRVKLTCDLDMGKHNGNNEYAFSLVCYDKLYEEGHVSIGIALPAIKTKSYWYSSNNVELYIDINNLFGVGYLGVSMNDGTTVKIKELSLLR